VSPPLVIALGAAFGICSIAIMYVYARATARFRASHKTIGRILTPIVVFAPLALLIMSYGHLVAAFGGTSHFIISAGMLLFAAIWFCGCLYVGLKFGPKRDQRL
jgi:uncharacterized membrane protein YbhN (UPF0104 family)